MNPGNRRRVILDGKAPHTPAEASSKIVSRKSRSSKADDTENAERPTPTASNMVTPQNISKAKVTFGSNTLKKAATNVSDMSDAGSKVLADAEVELDDMGKVVMGTALQRKGNEEKRRSYHYRLNTLNLVSSFLGILGLIVQIVEVFCLNLVPCLLLPCCPERIFYR